MKSFYICFHKKFIEINISMLKSMTYKHSWYFLFDNFFTHSSAHDLVTGLRCQVNTDRLSMFNPFNCNGLFHSLIWKELKRSAGVKGLNSLELTWSTSELIKMFAFYTWFAQNIHDKIQGLFKAFLGQFSWFLKTNINDKQVLYFR